MNLSIFFQHTFSILCLFLLFGCASSQMEKGSASDKAAENHSPGSRYGTSEGYLVLVITVVDGVVQSWDEEYDQDRIGQLSYYGLNFQGISSGTQQISESVALSSNFWGGFNKDFNTPYGVAGVFVVPLPGGNYAINDFKFYIRRANRLQWLAEEEFNVPFEIKPGMVTYLGEWRAFRLISKGPLGIIMPGGAFWSNVDNSTRDLEAAYLKHPYLRELPVSETIASEYVKDYFDYKDPLGEPN